MKTYVDVAVLETYNQERTPLYLIHEGKRFDITKSQRLGGYVPRTDEAEHKYLINLGDNTRFLYYIVNERRWYIDKE